MKKIYLLSSILGLFLAFGFVSCGGGDTDPEPKDDNNQVVPQNARVGFANGSDGIIKGSFSISTRIASQLAPGKHSNMADVLEGKHTIVIKNGDNNTEVFDQNVTLLKKHSYDFFLAGTAQIPTVVMVEQSFSVIDNNKAYVQFVNLIPDRFYHRMYLQRTDVGGFPLLSIGSKLSYKANSEVVALLEGTYVTEIVADEGRPRPDQVTKSQTLEAGKVYQVYSYREGNKIQSVFKLTSSFD